MALAKDIMGGGFSGGQATQIAGSRATGLTAAGTTQGTALALTASFNALSTVASGAGVILYDGSLSDSQIVYNGGANAVTIYPPVGDAINQVAVNGGVLLATNTMMILFKTSTTQWNAILSA